MKPGFHIPLLLVTVLALAIRFWGIYWGAPERIDLHPDEIDYVMKHAIGLMDRIGHVVNHPGDFNAKTLDPVFLNYPGFLMYLIALVAGVLRKIGIITEVWQSYIVGRSLVAIFGAATVPVVFWFALELGATRTGALLAAIWMALLPLHVWESHAAVTDIPMLFFTALTLVAALRLVRTGRWRDYAFAGAALGLAVGSKYTAAMVVVSILVAAFAARRPFVSTVAGLALAGFVSLACCFAVSPYSFLHIHHLMAAMSYEHHHTLSQHYGFSVYAVGWWYRRWIYQLIAGWPFSLGFALYVSCAAGTLWAWTRINRKLLVVFSFAAVYFYETGSWTFTPLRYYLPLLLIAVTFAGIWQGQWLVAPALWQRRMAGVAVAVTFLYTGLFTLQTTARYRHETRVAAGRWIQETAAPGSSIVIGGWRRYLGLPHDLERYNVRFSDERFLGKMRPDPAYGLIEISSLLYQRHYRHGNTLYMDAYNRIRDPAGPFELVKKFESHFINKNLYMKLDLMFEGYFISPTLEFYRVKTQSPTVAL